MLSPVPKCGTVFHSCPFSSFFRRTPFFHLSHPVKITHLITSLHGGGTENFLHQILSVAPQDIQQEVLYLKEDGVIGDRIRQLGIEVRHCSNFFSLVRHLRQNSPDVLHTLLYRAHQVGRCAGDLAGIPWVVSSQRSLDDWQKPWHGWLDRITLRWCNGIIANSEAAIARVRTRISKQHPLIFRKLTNGISPERFMSQDVHRARQEMQLPENALLAGTLMRLHKEKGADLLPEFAEALLGPNPRLHLVIGGTGPELGSIQNAMTGKLWASRVHWKGWVEKSPTFLAALDFFFLLSREESFPQALLEASAAGRPWIAPNVGDVQDLQQPGCSLVFQREDVRGALAAANQILQDLPTFAKNAETAAPVVHQRYAMDEMSRLFYSFLQDLRYNP